MTSIRNILLNKYREFGLVLIAIIYFLAYLTAKDPFWVGRATVFSGIVLLTVALVDLVKKNGMEKP